MTRYLLDTNVLTELEDRRKPGFALAAARLAALNDTDEVLLSILSVYEYHHGISKATEDLKESLLAAWRAFEERFPLVGLTSAGAGWAKIRTLGQDSNRRFGFLGHHTTKIHAFQPAGIQRGARHEIAWGESANPRKTDTNLA